MAAVTCGAYTLTYIVIFPASFQHCPPYLSVQHCHPYSSTLTLPTLPHHFITVSLIRPLQHCPSYPSTPTLSTPTLPPLPLPPLQHCTPYPSTSTLSSFTPLPLCSIFFTVLLASFSSTQLRRKRRRVSPLLQLPSSGPPRFVHRIPISPHVTGHHCYRRRHLHMPCRVQEQPYCHIHRQPDSDRSVTDFSYTER